MTTITIECDSKALRAAYKLPPLLCEVLHALVTLPLVTQEDVAKRTRSKAKKGGLKVAIFKLRKMLEPYGINIYSGTAVGYWLEDADKAKIIKHLNDLGLKATPNVKV